MSNPRAGVLGAALLLCCAFAGCAPPAVELPMHTPSGFALKHDRAAEHGCATRQRPDELLCRADMRMMEARRAGDSASVQCHEQRGRELRASWRQLDQSRNLLRASDVGDAGAELEQARVRAAEQSIERIFATLEDCELEAQTAEVEVRPINPHGDADLFATQPF